MKKLKKLINKILTTVVIVIISAFVYLSTNSFNEDYQPKDKYKEADYVREYCSGEIEHVLQDRTRVDCLTDEYAIEFDYAKKWAESIGQSLYYAKMTGKKPAVAIIMTSIKDEKYIERIKKTDENITIFEIKSKDFVN